MLNLVNRQSSEALGVIGRAVDTHAPLDKVSLVRALKLPPGFDSLAGYAAYRQLSKTKNLQNLRQAGNYQILEDIREVLKYNDEEPKKLRLFGVFEDKLDKYSGSEKIAASDFVVTVLESLNDFKITGDAISEVLGYFDRTPASQRADLLKAFDKAASLMKPAGTFSRIQQARVRIIKTLSRALNDKPLMNINELNKRIDIICRDDWNPSSSMFKLLLSHPSSSINALMSEVKRLSVNEFLDLKAIERLSHFFQTKNPNRDAIVKLAEQNNFNLDVMELFDQVKPKDWVAFSKYVVKGQFTHYPTLKIMVNLAPKYYQPFAEYAPKVGQNYPETLRLMLKIPVSDWQNFADNTQKILGLKNRYNIHDYLECMIKLPVSERSEFADVYVTLGKDAEPLRDAIAKLPKDMRIAAAKHLAKLIQNTARASGSYQIDSGKYFLKSFPNYSKLKIDTYIALSKEFKAIFPVYNLATCVDVIDKLHTMESKGLDVAKYVDAALKIKITDFASFKALAAVPQIQIEAFATQMTRLEVKNVDPDALVTILKTLAHQDLKLFVDIANDAKPEDNSFLACMAKLRKSEWGNYRDSYLAAKPYSYGLEKILAKVNSDQRVDAAKYIKLHFEGTSISSDNNWQIERLGFDIMDIFARTSHDQRESFFKAVKDFEKNNSFRSVSYRVEIEKLFVKAGVPLNQLGDYVRSAVILGCTDMLDIKAILQIPYTRLSFITDQAKRIGIKPVNKNFIKELIKLDSLQSLNNKPSLTHFIDQWLKIQDSSLLRMNELLSVPFSQLEKFVDIAVKYNCTSSHAMATMQKLKSSDWEPYAQAHSKLEYLEPYLTEVLGNIKSEDRNEIIEVWKELINKYNLFPADSAKNIYETWKNTPANKRQKLLLLTSKFNELILNNYDLPSKVSAYVKISQFLDDIDNTAAVINEVGHIYIAARITPNLKANDSYFALRFMPNLLKKNVEDVKACIKEVKRFGTSFDSYLDVLSKIEQDQITPLVDDALKLGVSTPNDLSRLNDLKYWQRPFLITTAEKVAHWNNDLRVLTLLQEKPAKDHKGTIQLANTIIRYGENVTPFYTLKQLFQLPRAERQQLVDLLLHLEPDQVNHNTIDTIVRTPKRSRERHVLGLMRPRDANCRAEEDNENVQRGERLDRTRKSLERLIKKYPVMSEKDAEVFMRKEILPLLKKQYDLMSADDSEKRSSHTASIFSKNKLISKVKDIAPISVGQAVPEQYRLTLEGRALDAVLRPYSASMHDYTPPIINNPAYSSGLPGINQIAVLVWKLVNQYDGQDKRQIDPKFVLSQSEKAVLQDSLRASYFKAIAGCIDPDDGHRVCSVGLSQQFATVLQGYYPEIEIDEIALDDNIPLTPVNVFMSEISKEYLRKNSITEIDNFVNFFEYAEQSAKDYYGDNTEIFHQFMKDQLVETFVASDWELPPSAENYMEPEVQ